MIYKWSGDVFCEIHKKRMAKMGKKIELFNSSNK